MDRIDAIYQRHVAALARIGIEQDAVRLSLRLALEEMEEGARGEGRGVVSIEDRTAAFHQMTSIGAWLAKHGDRRGEGMPIADAVIAFAEDRLAVISSLESQLAEKERQIDYLERKAAEWTRELRARRDAMDQGVEGATAILATVVTNRHTNGAGPIEAIRRSTWLRDEDREWLEGLERGAHTFRSVPKDVRRRLVQALIDTVRTDSEAPRQFDFDQSRPAWMPGAGGLATSFGLSWADLCAAKDMP